MPLNLPDTLQKKESKPHLPLHEWMAISCIVLCLLALSLKIFFFSDHSIPDEGQNPHYLVSQEIEVFVEGAVQKPGRYLLKKDAKLADLIQIAEPLPEANLNKLKMGRKLQQGQLIRVPSKKQRTAKTQKTKQKKK